MSGDLLVKLDSNKEILLAPQLKRSTVRIYTNLAQQNSVYIWWLFVLTFGAGSEE